MIFISKVGYDLKKVYSCFKLCSITIIKKTEEWFKKRMLNSNKLVCYIVHFLLKPNVKSLFSDDNEGKI